MMATECGRKKTHYYKRLKNIAITTTDEQTTQEEDSRDFTAAMMPSDHYVIMIMQLSLV